MSDPRYLESEPCAGCEEPTSPWELRDGLCSRCWEQHEHDYSAYLTAMEHAAADEREEEA